MTYTPGDVGNETAYQGGNSGCCVAFALVALIIFGAAVWITGSILWR